MACLSTIAGLMRKVLLPVGFWVMFFTTDVAPVAAASTLAASNLTTPAITIRGGSNPAIGGSHLLNGIGPGGLDFSWSEKYTIGKTTIPEDRDLISIGGMDGYRIPGLKIKCLNCTTSGEVTLKVTAKFEKTPELDAAIANAPVAPVASQEASQPAFERRSAGNFDAWDSDAIEITEPEIKTPARKITRQPSTARGFPQLPANACGLDFVPDCNKCHAMHLSPFMSPRNYCEEMCSEFLEKDRNQHACGDPVPLIYLGECPASFSPSCHSCKLLLWEPDHKHPGDECFAKCDRLYEAHGDLCRTPEELNAFQISEAHREIDKDQDTYIEEALNRVGYSEETENHRYQAGKHESAHSTETITFPAGPIIIPGLNIAGPTHELSAVLEPEHSQQSAVVLDSSIHGKPNPLTKTVLEYRPSTVTLHKDKNTATSTTVHKPKPSTVTIHEDTTMTTYKTVHESKPSTVTIHEDNTTTTDKTVHEPQPSTVTILQSTAESASETEYRLKSTSSPLKVDPNLHQQKPTATNPSDNAPKQSPSPLKGGNSDAQTSNSLDGSRKDNHGKDKGKAGDHDQGKGNSGGHGSGGGSLLSGLLHNTLDGVGNAIDSTADGAGALVKVGSDVAKTGSNPLIKTGQPGSNALVKTGKTGSNALVKTGKTGSGALVKGGNAMIKGGNSVVKGGSSVVKGGSSVAEGGSNALSKTGKGVANEVISAVKGGNPKVAKILAQVFEPNPVEMSLTKLSNGLVKLPVALHLADLPGEVLEITAGKSPFKPMSEGMKARLTNWRTISDMNLKAAMEAKSAALVATSLLTLADAATVPPAVLLSDPDEPGDPAPPEPDDCPWGLGSTAADAVGTVIDAIPESARKMVRRAVRHVVDDKSSDDSSDGNPFSASLTPWLRDHVSEISMEVEVTEEIQTGARIALEAKEEIAVNLNIDWWGNNRFSVSISVSDKSQDSSPVEVKPKAWQVDESGGLKAPSWASIEEV